MKLKIALFVPVLLVVIMCSGCWAIWLTGGTMIGAGAGVIGAEYVEGKLKGHMNNNPSDVAKATEKAFKVMGISQVSTTFSQLESEVVGRTSDGSEVKVWADATGKEGSDITIRIGWFGDEIKSRLIYDEISKQLQQTGYNNIDNSSKK